VAYCLADVWQALESARSHSVDDIDSKYGRQLETETTARLTGGITSSPLWAQIVADVLGVTLVSVEAADASAVGAAMLGHQALHSASLSELLNKIDLGPLFEPDTERHQLYVDLIKRFQALYRKVGSFERLEY
jgi:sugar (pentulose or hexulose) kinase